MYANVRPLSSLTPFLFRVCCSCLVHNSIHSRFYLFHSDRPGREADERTNEPTEWRTEEEDMYEQTATKHDIRPLIYGPWKMSIADTFTPTIPHLWPCSSGWPFANTRHVTVNVASSSFLIKHRRGQRKVGGDCERDESYFCSHWRTGGHHSQQKQVAQRSAVTHQQPGNKPARHSTPSVTVSISIFDKPPTHVTQQIKSSSLVLPPSSAQERFCFPIEICRDTEKFYFWFQPSGSATLFVYKWIGLGWWCSVIRWIMDNTE